MDFLTMIAIAMLIFILIGRSNPEIFTNCKRQVESMTEKFQDMIPPFLKSTYFTPVACSTRGLAPQECECSYEDYKAGKCPSSCGFNRQREPLISQRCQTN